MTMVNRAVIRSVAFWSDAFPDWPTLRAACRGEGQALADATPLPASALLSAAERRRAPESVQLALHVAHQAVQGAGFDARTLASVFASPHGDLGITHEQCATLAREPSAMSPTRFINSVHNAVSGHWGMVSRCARPSTAIAAGRHSFAAGLLEAAAQVACGGEPVLLVAYETEPRGATAQLSGTQGRKAVALVIDAWSAAVSDPLTAPSQDKAASSTGAVFRWWVASYGTSQAEPGHARSGPWAALQHNHLADALLWLHALATIDGDAKAVLALPLSADLDSGLGREAFATAAPSALYIEWEERL